jgi:hypothetical protein
MISEPFSLVTFETNNHCQIWLQNCAPYKITIEQGDIVGFIENEDPKPIQLNNNLISTICKQIYERLPKVKKKTWTRKEIEER